MCSVQLLGVRQIVTNCDFSSTVHFSITLGVASLEERINHKILVDHLCAHGLAGHQENTSKAKFDREHEYFEVCISGMKMHSINECLSVSGQSNLPEKKLCALSL